MKALLHTRFSILPAILLLAGSLALPSAANAYHIRGTGTAALAGHDLTDPEDDGDPESNTNYNAVFAASEEGNFGGDEGAFNVFDNRLGPNNDKFCCGDEGNFPAQPIFIDATFPAGIVLRRFTVSSAEDAPNRDPLVWKIQGSNDGTNFTDIFSRDSNTSVWTDRLQVVEFTAGLDYAVPAAFKTIRFVCSKTQAGFQLGELEYLDTAANLTVSTDTDENNGTSDPTQGTGTSLREALAYAATQTGPQSITFSSSSAFGAKNFHDGTAHTITTTGLLPQVTGTVVLTGPGAKLLTIQGQGGFNLFAVGSSGNLSASSLTITGAGIAVTNSGSATIANCTISNCSEGIANQSALANALKVSSSTFTGCNPGIYNQGDATIVNCTFSGNSEGLVHDSGTTAVANSTISNNSVTGLRYLMGGSGVAVLRNTICAGNAANTSGGVTDGGHSILTGTASDAGLDSNGLQDNGGPTKTIKLIPGSPAIDAGDNSLALDADGNSLTTDQRGLGFDRVVQGKTASANAIVDIGAFEVQVITFAPGVAANGVTVDANIGPFNLTSPTIDAKPTGGAFSGPGVDGNGVFHAELLDAGEYEITYTTTTPDAYGNVGTGKFTIFVTADAPYLRIVATVGPGGTGIDVPNEPAGTKFTQVGIASMDFPETTPNLFLPFVGARVRIKPTAGAEVPAIYRASANTVLSSFVSGAPQAPGGIAVRGGEPAPDGNGGTRGTFASFQEPVFGAGFYAFGATIAGAGVTKATDTGLWASVKGAVDLVAAEGGPVTGTDGNPIPGQTFEKIQSYVLTSDGQAISFLATVKGTGVKATNKTGVWQYRSRFDFNNTPLGFKLIQILRTGDLFFITTDFNNNTHQQQPVKSLTLFVPAKTIPGQRRSYATSYAEILAFAKFNGSHQALLGWADNGYFINGAFLDIENTTVGHPGIPSVNGDGYFAMRAGLSLGAVLANNPSVKISAKNDQTIITGRNQFNLDILAQEGSAVSSSNPEVFTAFDEPAFNDDYRTAFFARVKSPTTPASQQRVLIYANLEQFGYEPTVIARTGVPAVGIAGGVLWKDFTAMVLPDFNYGPIFLGKLSGPGVNKTNDTGLWATDPEGKVLRLLRTGDSISVGGTHKTVSLINTLGAALDSAGQGRHVNTNGNVSAQLTFTDGTVALVYFGLPTPQGP